MGGNTFGTLFRITTYGESHGPAIGVVIDGCPPGISLDESIIQKDLDRRRPGARVTRGSIQTLDRAEASPQDTAPSIKQLNPAVTARSEPDACEILSGIFEGKTTGTPLSIVIRNTSQKTEDYGDIVTKFRPGHADYTYFQKYGRRDYRGGGRSSGRETAARVAAGAVAKILLARKGISILAWTAEAAGIQCKDFDETAIEKNPMRACDHEAAEKMLDRITVLREKGDSAGGIITCRITGCPTGLGEPVFDKLDAELARAVLSVGAVKGIEFGAGFASAGMKGSEWNDQMERDPATGRPAFLSNNAGGILGGISNGAEILFRVAVKPFLRSAFHSAPWISAEMRER